MNFHPERALLEQYAAGTLPPAFALCVATHLNFCAQCFSETQALQNLGGLLFEELAPAPVDTTILQTVWEKIEESSRHDYGVRFGGECAAQNSVQVDRNFERHDSAHSGHDSAHSDKVPKALLRLIPDGYDALRWATILPGLRVAKLPFDDGEHHIALHRVRAGAKIARHDHRGAEITMVLNGSFSDEYGVYGDGDFILREPEQIHRPLAAQNEECICLSMQTAPVRFIEGFWRLLNPFLT